MLSRCYISCDESHPDISTVVNVGNMTYIQSRPIEMRATILYLANHWTEFEMLLTPLRFLYLVMFSLLAFPSIPQFIAHFWQISSFLCIVLPFSNSYRNESCSKACSAHFAPAAILFFLPFCE